MLLVWLVVWFLRDGGQWGQDGQEKLLVRWIALLETDIVKRGCQHGLKSHSFGFPIRLYKFNQFFVVLHILSLYRQNLAFL